MKIKASYIDLILVVGTIISGLISTRICQIVFLIAFGFIGIHFTFSRETFKPLRDWVLEVHEDD